MPLLDTLVQQLGNAHVLTETADVARYNIDERQLFKGNALAVVRPATTAEVAAVVKACRDHQVAMVAQGGNTGYCGGATASPAGDEIVISLERLNNIIKVDSDNAVLSLEAGCTLAAAQQAAADAGLLLPLSMGSEGSCQIGGNLSTNAGGLSVLRYGMSRDLVVGLEVVLADGSILSRLKGLRKDNTGYAVEQLFIGAEGTLGIITAAALKLAPRPSDHFTVLATLKTRAAMPAILRALQALVGDNVTAFEFISAESLALLTRAYPELSLPLGQQRDCLLIECALFSALGGKDSLAEVISDSELFSDALDQLVLAQTGQQRRELWHLREAVPAAEKHLGGSVKHDISVPIGNLGEFMHRATAAIMRYWPDARLSVYGHVGDGNVHFNVLAPGDSNSTQFKNSNGEAISDCLHELARQMHGSFSAEHGIGQLKRELLRHHEEPTRIELMQRIKTSVDPLNLMNPGKVI